MNRNESKISQISNLKHNFSLNVFEGPLDVLLYLAKTRQIEITDISLDELIEQYISYIESVQDQGINVASEYIEMAAELIRLKSKTLLPNAPLEELEEMLDGTYTREQLITKLIEYKKYKDVALKLEALHEKRPQHFYKELSLMLELRSINFQDSINLSAIQSAMEKVLFAQLEEPKQARTIEVKELDVESKLKALQTLSAPISFQRLIEKLPRAEKLAFFLALLEAIKLQYVVIEDVDLLIIKQGRSDD